MPSGFARFRIGVRCSRQRHALIGRRQEAAAPVRRAAARAARAGLQHDEPRQVARLAADAVGDPGPHARPAELRRAGVHEQLGRAVVEHVGRHRPHDADVVGDRRQVRQALGDRLPALAVLGELALRAQQLGVPLDEREPLVRDERLRESPGRPSSCSFGLWSNSSSWLGPPAMNRKMTFLACGGKCGGRAASGSLPRSFGGLRLPIPLRAARPAPSRPGRRRTAGRSAGGRLILRIVELRCRNQSGSHSRVMNSSRFSSTRQTDPRPSSSPGCWSDPASGNSAARISCSFRL